MTEESPSPSADETLRSLHDQLAELNAHRFVHAHDSWIGLFFFNLVRGLAFGLGSVIGATVLVSVLVYFLRQIDFLPLIGDYAIQLIEMIKEN